MEFPEINQENLPVIRENLESKGFKVIGNNEIESIKEEIKKKEIKGIWDKIDETIYSKTGLKKEVRDDHGLERSVDYYQRALDTLAEKSKGSEEAQAMKSKVEELQKQLDAAKSETPQEFETKFQELSKEREEIENKYKQQLEEKEKEFSSQLKHNEINSHVNALRGQFREDVPDIEDGIETKINRLKSLESKTTENGTIFYKAGEPLLNSDGKFMSMAEIVKSEFKGYLDEQKQPKGAGGNGSGGNVNTPTFNNIQELDQHLKEKFDNKVGSSEWVKERMELKAASGL